MEGETLGRKEAKERFYPRGMKERMVHGCSWAVGKARFPTLAFVWIFFKPRSASSTMNGMIQR